MLHSHLLSIVIILLLAFSVGESLPSTCRAAQPSLSDGQLLDEDLELQPGLVATYRSAAASVADPALVRIDAKPHFTLTAGSLHPRISPGAADIVWEGVILVRELDEVRFGAFLRGEVRMVIGGVTVFDARGESMTQWIQGDQPVSCEPGLYPIQIVFRSLADLPARLQIWWEGNTFSREILPAARLHHVAQASRDLVDAEERRESGRVAAQELGCARCHPAAFPALADALPGPALTNLPAKMQRGWLLRWLADPAQVREDARMPALFSNDRRGFVERSLISDFLLAGQQASPLDAPQLGSAETGRRTFVTLGCAACHLLPGEALPEQAADRISLADLANRTTHQHLVPFLREPHLRYPDGRMPNFRLSAEEATNLASYLLSPPPTSATESELPEPPRADEVARVLRELGAQDSEAAGKLLSEKKGCARCHPGLAPGRIAPVDIKPADGESYADRGCLSGKTLPRFDLSDNTRQSLMAFLAVAPQERHPAPFEARRQLLARRGCARCHQRDSQQRPAIEQAARTIWIKSKHFVYQRTPSLTGVLTKYRLDHLQSAIAAGVSGQRPKWYTYRMPAFGQDAAEIIQALAEDDGDHLASLQDATQPEIDPNVRDFGQLLVGFEGYSCVSCHVWKGDTLRVVEPSSAGPELTTVTKRIRREWFDRWLENPLRIHPQTPMPAVFRKGQPATINNVLNGDPQRQKDALWTYLSRGADAPDPRRKPAFALAAPLPGEPPQVAQIPLRTPDLGLVESISLWNDHHDLVLYDVGQLAVRNVYTGARIVCKDGYHAGRDGYYRDFNSLGTAVSSSPWAGFTLQLQGVHDPQDAQRSQFLGYDRLADGVRIRSRHQFQSATVNLSETLKIDRTHDRLTSRLRFTAIPAGSFLQLRTPLKSDSTAQSPIVSALQGGATRVPAGQDLVIRLDPTSPSRHVEVLTSYSLPPAEQPPVSSSGQGGEVVVATGDEFFEQDRSRLERPGYRAIRYPRPTTATGEDLVMPSALATHPKSGQLFVASSKFGELFRLEDPHDDGTAARFVDYTGGRFQDVFGMLHDGQALYLLHRRNLTKLRDTNDDGLADRFDRVARINQAIGEQYDWAYGLVRDRQGRFLLSLAPWGKTDQQGAGSVLRLPRPGDETFQEIAFGLRNPVGWSQGPEGDVFFTDNQGNWVETNKLCQLETGRFYGYVNSDQPQHSTKPRGSTAVWVPYEWAQSINGVTYDTTQGKFGPFAGQFFMAELMRGGAIIRASLEKVKGVYQGACFPFWGKGLMGPLALCFDPRGRLYVGSITEPAWMAQPDRGGLFRIDFTGQIPFELETIRVRPQGFRLKFTAPAAAARARETASYRIDQYRYEYSSAYGSPELDRAPLAVRAVRLSADGRTVDLDTGPLKRGHIYEIKVRGVLSLQGESLVHDTGVYTLNELPER